MSGESSTITIPALRLERRESPEFVKPLINLCARQRSKPFHTELLAAEATHHRTVNYSAMELFYTEITVVQIKPSLGKIPHESPREAVPGACRIENILE